MENIINLCFNVFSKAVGDVCMCLVDMATGTISFATIYEPEMPIALRPNDCEEEHV